MFRLEKLKLENFRCFDKYELEIDDKINIFVGNNAVGKTSIVEAIHCLGLAKSLRTKTDQELIQIGKEYSIVKGNFKIDDKSTEITFSITTKGKKIIKDNKPYSNLSEYIGYINIVVFSPEDMEIIKGSPATRRKFLDSNISQISSIYLKSSIKYKRLLKERNELLKNINKNNNNLLEIYTKELMSEAKVIIEERTKFVEKINPYLKAKTTSISEDKEDSEMVYIPSVELNNIEQAFEESLANDLLYKTTSKGPHRDDFILKMNNLDASSFSSQGQQRTLVLGLKLALAEIISLESDNILIILDDVFSELDFIRQNQIINLLDNNNQIFITTTSIENLTTKILEGSSIHYIDKEDVEDGKTRSI